MVRRLSVQEACGQFGDLVREVKATQQPVVIEEDGKPAVAIISAARWEAMQQARERGWAAIEEIRRRNAHLDPDEVYADVTAIVEEVRQERYEQEQRADRDNRRKRDADGRG